MSVWCPRLKLGVRGVVYNCDGMMVVVVPVAEIEFAGLSLPGGIDGAWLVVATRSLSAARELSRRPVIVDARPARTVRVYTVEPPSLCATVWNVRHAIDHAVSVAAERGLAASLRFDRGRVVVMISYPDATATRIFSKREEAKRALDRLRKKLLAVRKDIEELLNAELRLCDGRVVEHKTYEPATDK